MQPSTDRLQFEIDLRYMDGLYREFHEGKISTQKVRAYEEYMFNRYPTLFKKEEGE